MLEIFEKFKKLGWKDDDILLASEEDLKVVENKLQISLPESYKLFAMNYLNIGLRGIQFLPLKESNPMYILSELRNAQEYSNLPKHLIPFVNDNDDFYCFNLKSKQPDYQVVYWSHNGVTDEKWENFTTWIDKCLIGEYMANKSKYDFKDLF
jgi:hypothetical protein